MIGYQVGTNQIINDGLVYSCSYSNFATSSSISCAHVVYPSVSPDLIPDVQESTCPNCEHPRLFTYLFTGGINPKDHSGLLLASPLAQPDLYHDGQVRVVPSRDLPPL